MKDTVRRAKSIGAVTELRETLCQATPFPLFENLSWQERSPGLVAGITAAGADFGISTASSAGDFFANHASLTRQLGFGATAMVSQLHGSRIVHVNSAIAAMVGVQGGTPHFHLAGRADGLLTSEDGVLLAVTAADCVPVYLVESSRRLVGLLHAGWRGVVAGVLEAAVERVSREWPGIVSKLRLHLGPAICGACYEVGSEVAVALDLGVERCETVDLRSLLADRAVAAGIDRGRITVSAWCTRCGGDRFFSHRGSKGRAGRMLAFIGWRRRGPPRRVAQADRVGSPD